MQQPRKPARGLARGNALLVVGLLIALTALVGVITRAGDKHSAEDVRLAPVVKQSKRDDQPTTARFFANGGLTVWWDRRTAPATVTTSLIKPEDGQASQSNIHPTDYAGPESCRKCHKKN